MTVIPQPIARRHGFLLRGEFRAPIVVAVAYYLGAEAAFFIGTLSDRIFAPFWPPNIVLFCAFLLSHRNRWWLFVLAALPSHIMAEASVGMGAAAMAAAFITNCMVAIMTAATVRLLIGESNWFSSLRGAAVYILIAVVLSPAIVAVAGAFVQILNGGAATLYANFWARWYVANALGAAILGPFAMIIFSEKKYWSRRPFTRHHLEPVVFAIALTATSMFAFGVTASFIPTGYLPTLLYLPLPIIAWAAVRFGVVGASGSVLIVGMVLLGRTLSGNNLFNVGDAEANVFAVQIFLIGLSVPMTLLGAAVEESRLANKVTRESQERMAFGAASADIGLWGYTFETGAFWATEHSRKMFGLPPERWLGFDELLARIHPNDFEMASKAVRTSIQQRVALDCEARIRKNGGARWISIRARPHQDSTGNIVEMTGIFADITSRKVAQEEALLRQQEVYHLMRVSMLGEISGGLAHELTQPLTAILSNAQAGRMLLLNPDADLEAIADIFDDIIAADGRAGEVIHHLRGLLKSGERHSEEVEINGLITSTLNLLHSEIIGRGVTISASLVPGLPFVRGDPVQLQQVLLNLLLNAIDAMEKLPTSRRVIFVRSANSNCGVEVNISDRGVGLPMGKKDHLFKPFFTTKKLGLGIGLSICNSIIKSHGGTLALRNNDDEGATATFRLPSRTM